MEQFVLSVINEIRESKGLKTLNELDSKMRLREDLELASFDLAELTVKVEDKFDIDIFEDGLVNTIGEIYAKLSK